MPDPLLSWNSWVSFLVCLALNVVAVDMVDKVELRWWWKYGRRAPMQLHPHTECVPWTLLVTVRVLASCVCLAGAWCVPFFLDTRVCGPHGIFFPAVNNVVVLFRLLILITGPDHRGRFFAQPLIPWWYRVLFCFAFIDVDTLPVLSTGPHVRWKYVVRLLVMFVAGDVCMSVVRHCAPLRFRDSWSAIPPIPVFSPTPDSRHSATWSPLAPWLNSLAVSCSVMLMIGAIDSGVVVLAGLCGPGWDCPSRHQAPLMSRNLHEFWSVRWNRLFGGMFKDLFFVQTPPLLPLQPANPPPMVANTVAATAGTQLHRRVGHRTHMSAVPSSTSPPSAARLSPTPPSSPLSTGLTRGQGSAWAVVAVMCVFLASGFLHAFPVAVAVGAPVALPLLLYFVWSGVAFLLERSCWRAHGVVAWVMAALSLLVPVTCFVVPLHHIMRDCYVSSYFHWLSPSAVNALLDVLSTDCMH